MSWIDDVVSLGSSALSFLGGNTIGSQLARTAVTGLVLNQVAKSITKGNETQDKGTRVQVDPDPEARVPVIYGDAVTSGIITDAVLTNGNVTMFYCLTLCEKTGNTALGAGAPSDFIFRDVYWNDNKLLFGSDGVTVSGYLDKGNNVCTDIAGKIKVYCYGGSSTTPKSLYAWPSTNFAMAYDVMPGWTANHQMSNLVFAIVRIDYDAEARVTDIGNFRFDISNSLTQPGDCIFDYMTNTRYGAGLDSGDIYAS
jgi:hypothetical protein